MTLLPVVQAFREPFQENRHESQLSYCRSCQAVEAVKFLGHLSNPGHKVDPMPLKTEGGQSSDDTDTRTQTGAHRLLFDFY